MGIYVAILSGRTSMIFICLGLLLAMFYTAFLENKIFSKLEEILRVQLKKDKSFSKESYTYEGLSWGLLMLF